MGIGVQSPRLTLPVFSNCTGGIWEKSVVKTPGVFWYTACNIEVLIGSRNDMLLMRAMSLVLLGH